MDREDLSARYVLVRKLHQNEVDTWSARTPAGDRVMVHFVSGGSTYAEELSAKLDGLDAQDREKIVLVESFQGDPVIVTEWLEDAESFEEWVQTAGPTLGGEEVKEPGEFTRMFLQGTGRKGGDELGQRVPAERSGSPGAPEKGHELGGPRQQPGYVEPSPPQRHESETGSNAGPGEFTRLFSKGRPPEPPQSSPADPPGDALSQLGDNPGRDTPQPLSRPRGDEYLDRLREAPETGVAGMQPAPPPPALPPAPSGPSEYTRLLGVGATPPPPSTPPKHRPPPSEVGATVKPKKRSFIIGLLAAVGFVMLLLITLAILAVFRGGDGAAGEAEVPVLPVDALNP